MNAQVNELQVIDQNVIVAAFQKENGTKSLYEQIANNARSIVFNMNDKKERDALKSYAYNLARTKTTVDNYGKELVSGIKAQAAVIDADRKFWRDNMDLLQEEIRKPLTDFENAEKARIKRLEDEVAVIKMPANLCGEWDATSIKDAIQTLENKVIDSSFEEFEQEAKIAKFETLEKLRTALVAREKYEAEQAELERLRKEQLEREQRECDERIAKEAADKARIEAEEKARFEAERVEREKREAEQREARLKAEKEAAELRAAQAAENERKRIEAEQFSQAEAARRAEEARLADVEHRRQINREALEAIKGVCPELSEPQVKSLVGAIISGLIPHVSIKY
jgi:chromosome segregation ATPase